MGDCSSHYPMEGWWCRARSQGVLWLCVKSGSVSCIEPCSISSVPCPLQFSCPCPCCCYHPCGPTGPYWGVLPWILPPFLPHLHMSKTFATPKRSMLCPNAYQLQGQQWHPHRLFYTTPLSHKDDRTLINWQVLCPVLPLSWFPGILFCRFPCLLLWFFVMSWARAMHVPLCPSLVFSLCALNALSSSKPTFS